MKVGHEIVHGASSPSLAIYIELNIKHDACHLFFLMDAKSSGGGEGVDRFPLLGGLLATETESSSASSILHNFAYSVQQTRDIFSIEILYLRTSGDFLDMPFENEKISTGLLSKWASAL